jgi:hypothetical protein
MAAFEDFILKAACHALKPVNIIATLRAFWLVDEMSFTAAR